MTGQAMMRITRAKEYNRGDSAHTSISDRSAQLAMNFCNQAVSLMPELTITSARQ